MSLSASRSPPPTRSISTVSLSPSRAVSLPLSTALVQSRFSALHCGRACPWGPCSGLLRGPCSGLLWAGLDKLSPQAAAGDPPSLFVTVQVWQAETLPAHRRPLRVHTLRLLPSCRRREGGGFGLLFILKKTSRDSGEAHSVICGDAAYFVCIQHEDWQRYETAL